MPLRRTTISSRLAISFGVSSLILGIIYWKIDLSQIFDVFARIDGPLFIGSFALLFSAIFLSAMRFRLLMEGPARPSQGLATKLILSAATLNLVLPSKMGDMLKSVFMRQTLKMPLSLAVSVVIFEKFCDLLGLLTWCLLGLVVYTGNGGIFMILALTVGLGLGFGVLMLSSLSFADWFLRLAARMAPSALTEKFEKLRKSWAEVHAFFWRSPRNILNVTGLTLLIWLLHLLQIWVLAVSVAAPMPIVSSFGLSSLAILAGLAPLTMAGVGTRDAAVIFLFAPFMATPAGAALGLMLTLRYILPGLAGLPFLSNYISMLRQQRPDV